MQQSKNKNLLKIDYDKNRGLILKWNLNKKSQTQFSKHIVILDV